MKIHSNDIPQADNLEDVIKTVIAVAQGHRTFQQIAFAIGKVERQGRYYRRAGEILGFIKNRQNTSVLTSLGSELISTEPNLTNPILLHSVLNSRIFQRLIAFFELNPDGVDREQIRHYLGSVTKATGHTMLPRRMMSLISWLSSLNLIEERNHKLKLKRTIISKIPILEFKDNDEPILPRASDLGEYQTVGKRVSNAEEEVVYYRNQAKLDRADNAHRHLVNLVAERIRRTGQLPRNNGFIDLAARIDSRDFIFEMKSLTRSNARSQIRRGVSQLYEYRYLQNLSGANLVLVVENNLPSNMTWMSDYLELDREIMLLWDGDNRLFAKERTKSELSFLWG